MIDIFKNIFEADSALSFMTWLSVLFSFAVIALAGFVIKILLGIYHTDKAMLKELFNKSIQHDQEHININNEIKNTNKNITSMLKEIQANRENDRQLLSIVANKAKIKIPEL